MVEAFVIATQNPNKAREIEGAVGSKLLLVRSAGQLPCVEETASTLKENALLKAWSAVRATGLSALADDTALEIDALSGRPGLYTARYARAMGSFPEATRAILFDLKGRDCHKKSARFRTVAVAVLADGTELTASGVLEGHIAEQPAGEGGFGFDPIFKPNNAGGRTLAQLPAEASDKISHRAKAFRALADMLEQLGYARPDSSDRPMLRDLDG
jgi:XTP/dITP diphosphohydrolase